MTRFLLTVFLLVTLLIRETYCNQNYYFGSFRNAGSLPGSNATLTTLLITLQDTTTSSHITIETLTQGIIHTLTLTPQNITTEINLPEQLIVYNTLDRYKGIHLHSTNKVFVTTLSQNNNSSDAYQIYPVPNYSNDTNYSNEFVYYAITPGASQNATGQDQPQFNSQILLISTEDNSIIKISPKKDVNISNDLQDLSGGNLIIVPAGSTYTGTLHRLQTLSFESVDDLTGSMITSSQPLTVISGHECAQFNNDLYKSSQCSLIAEQIPSTNVWGTSHIASSFSINETQNYIIMSNSNHTNVKQTCNNDFTDLTTTTTYYNLTEGETHQFTAAVFCFIESNFPILIASIYVTGNHPLMSLIPPVEQYRSDIVLSSFSCSAVGNTNSTQAMLFLNGTQFINNDSIPNNTPYGSNSSVQYLNFDTNFVYRQVEEFSNAIVYSLTECQYAFTIGWSDITLNFTISQPAAAVTTTYSFGTPIYEVSESRETVYITIIKNNNTNVQTSVGTVVTTCDSCTNESYSNTDFIILNESIVFDVGVTRATLAINITNDEYVEPQESYTISLTSSNSNINSGEVTLIIIDDDSLIVGLNNMIYEPSTQLLSFEVGINYGVLAQNINFGLIIKLVPQQWILVDSLKFTHETIAHVVKVNLTRISTALVWGIVGCDFNENTSIISQQCILTTQISLETPSTLNITLSPNQLNGTLASFVQVDEQTCNYIVGEFTQTSLLITACITGTLLLLTLLSIAIGIAGFGLSYHTRRKWTLGGGLNKLYFQDDAMSLATNDPESYELMNRLGEKQTAILAINDDNEY